MPSTPIHGLRVSDVFLAMETSSRGLSEAESSSRLLLYGDNYLTDKPNTNSWRRYARHFRHPFFLLGLAIIIVSVWQKDLTLAVITAGISLANSTFSFWREHGAERAVEKLRHLLPAYAHLIREGKEVHSPSIGVVPGDILILSEGDNIPADARIIEEFGLRVNNAALTGESVATRKTADASLSPVLSELDRPNLIFAGTSVASGTGKAVVYATGMMTQFGRIAHLTQSVPESPSIFQKELEKIGRIITLIALGIGAIVWVLSTSIPQYARHYPNPVLLALGTILAVTPEGLPATLTLSLAMAVQRLTGKGVLVKRLSIIETLGNISIICTDKSGTLTQNQMTVRECWLPGLEMQVSGVGYEPMGDFSPPPRDTLLKFDLDMLMTAAMCCNNARIRRPAFDHPNWSCLGDQTEAALKVVAMKAGLVEEQIGVKYPRIHEIPFDARRKRMTTIHKTPSGMEIAFIKGAPREMLQQCSRIRISGTNQSLTPEKLEEILSINDRYARKALRVLAVAYKELPGVRNYSGEEVEQDLILLGLIAMMDPPRIEVEQAIRKCREAGIRITMITGDYGLTAESIARRVGMITGPAPTILTGAELDAMNDALLERYLDNEVIFARMAPEHKLRLVSAYQAHGDVVAVTGDGVNDAPALRKADVGIAMGKAGTDVAKEAADIILTNDNFDSITTAIEEGRAIYDNIRKFITYIFSSNVPEVLPFLLTSSIGIPPALAVKQILAIDMGTDILPAIALGTEKPEPGIMGVPPRKRSAQLIDRGLLLRSFLWLGLIETILCYIGYFAIYLFSGNAAMLNLPILENLQLPVFFPNIQDVQLTARTVFFAGVIFAQIGNAYACRTYTAHNTQIGWGSNRPLLLGILLSLIVILLLVYLPPLARLFDNEIFPPILWLVLSLYTPVLYTLDWIRKHLVYRRNRQKTESKLV